MESRILFDFVNESQILCKGVSEKTQFTFRIGPDPLEFTFSAKIYKSLICC